MALHTIRRQLNEADVYFSKNEIGVNERSDGTTYTISESWDVSGAKLLIKARQGISTLRSQGHEIPEDIIESARQLEFKYWHEHHNLSVDRHAAGLDKSCGPHYKQYFVGFSQPADHLSILDIGGATDSSIRQSLLERMVQRVDYTRIDKPVVDSEKKYVRGNYKDPETAKPYSIGEELAKAEQERLKEMEAVGYTSGFVYINQDNINLHRLRQEVLRNIVEGAYSRYELSMFWDARHIPYPFDDQSFDEIHCHMIDKHIVSGGGLYHPSIDDFVAEIERLSHVDSRFFFTVQESGKVGQFFPPRHISDFGGNMNQLRTSFERQGFEIEEFKVQSSPIGYEDNSLAALTMWCYFTNGLLIARKTQNLI